MRQLRRDVDPDLTLLTGMALGWDQDAAAVARSEGVPFRAYVPFLGQDARWPAPSRDLYRRVLAAASGVVVCSESEDRSAGAVWAMLLARNAHMMQDCDLVVAVWDGTSGGTAHAVACAQQAGKPLVVLDPRAFTGSR